MKILQQKLKAQLVDMVSKHSNIIDKLLESVYTDSMMIENSFEQGIVEIMIDLDCTLSEALEMDFDLNGINKSSVFDLVDYLERRLNSDLNKVEVLMQIYTQQNLDFKLTRIT